MIGRGAKKGRGVRLVLAGLWCACVCAKMGGGKKGADVRLLQHDESMRALVMRGLIKGWRGMLCVGLCVWECTFKMN